MKFLYSVVVFVLWHLSLYGQKPNTLSGFVVDKKTKEPLAFATISVKGTARGAISLEDGKFELKVPSIETTDTLAVTHLGYAPFEMPLGSLQPGQIIYLEESFVLLDAITISRVAVRTKDIEKGLRVIRGSLHGMETEVTNKQYNLFLASLEEQGLLELNRKCVYDLSAYDKSSKAFFTRYVTTYKFRKSTRDTIKTPHIGPQEWSDYPAVNISHAAAQEYCRWLTEQYNVHAGKKRYKRVLFRLPTLREWQIAALGYDKFQSWQLEDNRVDVIISPDSVDMLPKKGVRKSIPVAHDVLYPWYGSYYYRRSPQNHKNCFLGNFKVEYVDRPCPANNPYYDGWSMMGRTASYFPNNMGLYDVVGNVAEMIDEIGKACGGSWDHLPSESTIHSVSRYQRPGAAVGFRVFMEVVDN
ncbi:MAG: SUMF1/EgtB/PvdO family nonheme iron enzyme [Chryseolinea sp.]